MSQSSDSTTTAESTLNAPLSTPLRKGFRLGAWITYGTLCLVLFTFLKLPDDRIKNFIEGSLSSFLATKGISMVAKESHLSLWFGLTYVMKDVTLTFPAPTP